MNPMQGVESYQRQRDALLLLRYVALGERGIREGAILPDAEADTHFRDTLESLAEPASHRHLTTTSISNPSDIVSMGAGLERRGC